MKILLLSFYFQPDLSAGSFRATALVRSLKAIDPTVEIHVITTLPNRYQSFHVEAPEYENSEGVEITRVALPPHNSGMIDQSKAFVAFIHGVRRSIEKKSYDMVVATSSRLMTAALGAWAATKTQALLYLDIRDIFADTIKDVLPAYVAMLVMPIVNFLERRTVSAASKVNVVSGGFLGYFEARYPGQNFICFPNGIDDEFISASPQEVTTGRPHHPLVVIYAGNLGEGQGLHSILPAIAKRSEGRLSFRIFGDGGRKALLLKKLEESCVSNVEIFPPVSRDRLIDEYRKADIFFLHLNDYDAFKKVLPSKLFEYGALGKPIWAGVSGFSADFVRREIDNAVVFRPCDADAAMQVLDDLVIEDRPRTQFTEKYSRTAISLQLAADILSTIQRKP